MPQRVQRTFVQVGDVPGFFGAGGAQQVALNGVKVELSPILLPAAGTRQHIGHVPGQRH